MATTGTARPLAAAQTMAAGTLASRASGVARVLVLAWVLGFTPLADAYNLANTIPNMLYDVVLGGIATATFVPVFVERLHRDGERRAWRSISAVVTISSVVLVVASVATFLLAPWIIDAFTAFNHLGDDPQPPRARPAARRRDHAAAVVQPPDPLLRPAVALDGAAQRARSLRGARVGAGHQQPRLHRGALLVRRRRPGPLARLGDGGPTPAGPPRARHDGGRGAPGARARSVARPRRRAAASGGASTCATTPSAPSGGCRPGRSASSSPTSSRSRSCSRSRSASAGTGRCRRTPTAGPSCRCPTPSSPSPSWPRSPRSSRAAGPSATARGSRSGSRPGYAARWGSSCRPRSASSCSPSRS